MQKLKEGTKVYTWDGREAGKISRFVLNPKTNELTHFIVQRGLLGSEEKVVPFEMFHHVTEGQALFREDLEDFEHLPSLEEKHFIHTPQEDHTTVEFNPYRSGLSYYWYPPLGNLGYPEYGLSNYAWPQTETNRNIPAQSVPLTEGTNVISSDGTDVGHVERLFLEYGSHKTLHFLISKGIFFRKVSLFPRTGSIR